MPEDLRTENVQALDRFEAQLVKPLIASRNAYAQLVIPEMLAGRADAMAYRLAYTAEVQDMLAQHSKRVIPFFAKMASAEIGLSMKEDFETLYSRWINTVIFQHSAIIAETATDEIFGIVQELIASGAGDREVANAIEVFTDASRYQARLVARTETHQAAMFAKKEQALAIETRSGIEMVKFWNAVDDLRTRESHRSAETTYSKGIAMGERFMVDGDSMDRPGDPSASASNLCNCRCVLTMRPKGY